MFINDDLVFIQLQKTGCTHIAELIHQRWPGSFPIDAALDKHQPLTEDPGRRAVVGSVRNPLSWYVSLWAYGCQQKGSLAWVLTASPGQILRTQVKQALVGRQSPVAAFGAIGKHAGKDAAFWRRVYSDSDNAGHFREWLHAIHSDDGGRLMTEGFADWGLRRAVGFYTYRFLSLFSAQDAWKAGARGLSDYDQLRAFDEANCIVEHFVRTECIDADLSRVMSDITGKPVQFGTARQAKTNRSKHRPAEDYYDPAARALILERDRLIFERFYPGDRSGGVGTGVV